MRCVHCNALTRVMERPRSVIQCPNCEIDAEFVALGPIVVDSCTLCGSLWFDSSELERASAAADGTGGADFRDAVRALVPRRTRDWERSVVSCPFCPNHLIRRDHPTVPRVVAHVCPSHGAWLQPRPLLKLMDDLEAHGLLRLAAFDEDREDGHKAQARAAREHGDFMFKIILRNLYSWIR